MSMKSLITGWVAAAAMFTLVGCGSLTYTFKGTPKAPEMDMTINAELKKDSAKELPLSMRVALVTSPVGGGPG